MIRGGSEIGPTQSKYEENKKIIKTYFAHVPHTAEYSLKAFTHSERLTGHE
jgi:hypothetical protein